MRDVEGRRRSWRSATSRRLRLVFGIVRTFRNWIPVLMVLSFRSGNAKPIRISTRDGVHLWVRHSFWDMRILTEQFVEEQYALATRSLPPLSIIVDIGGFVGDFAIWASKNLQSVVHVYEPDPQNLRLLRLNLSENPTIAHRISVHPFGVGVPGSKCIQVVDIDDGHHVSEFLYKDHPDAISVPMLFVSLTEVLVSLPVVDLLKLDCEGCEYLIVDELEKVEALGKLPRRIIIEFTALNEWEQQVNVVLRRLVHFGYTIDRRGMVAYAAK